MYVCSPDIICPDGFVLVPKVNSCYKLITEIMNWANASKMCQSIARDVHLATITSPAENEAISAFFDKEIYSKYTSAPVEFRSHFALKLNLRWHTYRF